MQPTTRRAPTLRSTPDAELERRPGPDPAVYAASIQLDASATVTRFSEPARRLLGYTDASLDDSCFFSLVHGQNLMQVMRDLADMVCRGRRSSGWLIRLRTAAGSWQWLRASAQNRLEGPTGDIIILLRALDTGA